jgi:O-antigen/teichoic acid export membrane protein
MNGRLMFLSGASAMQMASTATCALLATRALGPADRGVMVLGLTVGAIVGMAGGLGTGTAVRSQLPVMSPGRARLHLLSAYTWCSIGSAVLAPVVAVAVVGGSAGFIDPTLGSTPFLLATAIFTLAQTLQTQIVEVWFADGRFRRGSLAAAAMNVLALGCLVAALAGTRSVSALLCAQAAGMLAVVPVQVAALRRHGLVVCSPPRAVALGSLVRRGLPALGLTVGLTLALRADRYLLGALAGTAALGVYSLAATVSEVARILPTVLGQLFLRDVSLGRGASRLVRTTGVAVAAAVVCGTAVLLGGWLLIVPVFGPEFTAARPLLVVLVIAEVCFAPYAVTCRGLLGGGWTRTAGVLGIVSGFGAIAVYAVGAAAGGSVGTAVGNVIMYGTLSALAFVLLKKRLARVEDPPLTGVVSKGLRR